MSEIKELTQAIRELIALQKDIHGIRSKAGLNNGAFSMEMDCGRYRSSSKIAVFIRATSGNVYSLKGRMHEGQAYELFETITLTAATYDNTFDNPWAQVELTSDNTGNHNVRLSQ